MQPLLTRRFSASKAALLAAEAKRQMRSSNLDSWAASPGFAVWSMW
jgi:hypothetical protein